MSKLPKTRQKDHPVLFELGAPGLTGVSLPESDVPKTDRSEALPAELLADTAPGLPQVGELDVVRHYKRLAHRCFSIDGNFYPLGSCTMKYNPRIAERIAGLPGFQGLHPYQDESDVQGLLELLYLLRCDLAEIAGLAEVSLQPAAGAHGELTALMMINAYHQDRGEKRTKVLAPDSAHGTNPASCAVCGRDSVAVRSTSAGRVDLNDLKAKVDEDTAAFMITNPNTVGVFDEQIADIAEVVHAKGAQVYLDGANMNAILGIIKPGEFGVDCMHYNTHKTFATPHGGGGPGAGPVAVAEHLRDFLPVPQVVKLDDGTFTWTSDRRKSIGKVRSFYGQVGILVRAYSYLRGLGRDGLRDVSETAVLAANYVAARLKDRYRMPFAPPYAHEFITVPDFPGSQVTELDIAKRLIDHGIHPPTMSWPIHHCLMIEPTETESLATLDAFVGAMLEIADEVENDPDTVRSAPHTTVVRRLDEVAASRKPNVRWRE
ncbi:MAG: aminomethyl-transferring glycine dehydrogenase subunit GcvPB [Phycisphaerae bacterium]|jgi:glycine dehydrogenase subunit 2